MDRGKSRSGTFAVYKNISVATNCRLTILYLAATALDARQANRSGHTSALTAIERLHRQCHRLKRLASHLKLFERFAVTSRSVILLMARQLEAIRGIPPDF